MTTVDSGRRPMVGDILDDTDDPILNVTPGWASNDYGEPALEAWLRHCKLAIGQRPNVDRPLRAAVKEWPILKEARSFLSPEDYVGLVGHFNPAWRKAVRAGVTKKG